MSGGERREMFIQKGTYMFHNVCQWYLLSSNENNETNMKRNHYLYRVRDGNTNANAWVPFREMAFT